MRLVREMNVRLSVIQCSTSAYIRFLLALSLIVLLNILMVKPVFADFPPLNNQQEALKSQGGIAPKSLGAEIKDTIDNSLQPFSGSVLLLQNNEPLLKMNKGRGINQRSSFIIASLSKQITATLVLRAIDSGNLDLNTSINSYLFDGPYTETELADVEQAIEGGSSEEFDAKFEVAPTTEEVTKLSEAPSTKLNRSNDCATIDCTTTETDQTEVSPSIIYGIDTEAQSESLFNPHRYNQKITIHQLLSHTSGVSKLGTPNHFTPGNQFKYSNLGYSLLAEILEKAYQQPFSEQITRFAMENGISGLYAEVGTVDNIRQRAPSLAIGLNEVGNTLTPSNLENTADLLPAGGLISTAKAFSTFQQKLHSGKLMTPKSYNLMTSSYSEISFLWPDMSYGYGLRINREDGITEYSHTGYIAGYMSMSLHYPEFNLDLIILENISLNLNDLDRVFELHNKVRTLIRQSLIAKQGHESNEI
ncbi:serine hydrolase [Shewanella sp. UCD-KL12]|uniref:serine hydrolase domain-containing protein n=1 Tax=Shewanella sp. UCD-KL12 TaxID=1917163 RepID=UPI002116FDA1|nr:serine hydrolase domain-containing protein [Shewanella sp. UCD-KL12]